MALVFRIRAGRKTALPWTAACRTSRTYLRAPVGTARSRTALSSRPLAHQRPPKKRRSEGVLEVRVRHLDGVQHLRVDLLGIDIDQVHLLSNGLEGCLHAQLGYIRPDVPVGVLCDPLQVAVLR